MNSSLAYQAYPSWALEVSGEHNIANLHRCLLEIHVSLHDQRIDHPGVLEVAVVSEIQSDRRSCLNGCSNVKIGLKKQKQERRRDERARQVPSYSRWCMGVGTIQTMACVSAMHRRRHIKFHRGNNGMPASGGSL